MKKNTEGPALFLDSANIDEMISVMPTSAIAGVTTNPSLIAKEAKEDYELMLIGIASSIATLCGHSDVHLSVEVTTMVPGEMIDQGRRLYEQLSQLCDVHIKIPMMLETLWVVSKLENEGIPVNSTCIMHAEQAKLAMDAGASFVSFFYNRMKDGGIECPEYEVSRFKNDYRKYNSTKIICGSIRTPQDVVRCWEMGADVVTAGLHVIRLLTQHHKTTEAIERFQKDIDGWLKK